MQYRTSYSCTIVLSPRTAEGGGRLAFAGAPSLQRHIVPRQAITLRTSARKTSEGLSNAFKAMQPDLRPRLRLLALHSFRTSARIFAEQVRALPFCAGHAAGLTSRHTAGGKRPGWQPAELACS